MKTKLQTQLEYLGIGALCHIDTAEMLDGRIALKFPNDEACNRCLRELASLRDMQQRQLQEIATATAAAKEPEG